MSDYWGTSGGDAIAGGAQDDSIYGLGGDDVLNGGDGYDRLYGGDGDDSFEESDGLDVIDGGSGADRLVLAGTRSDYSYSPTTGGAIVQRLDNSGAYHLTSVEWVYFAGEDALVRLYELTPTVATEDGDYLLGTDGDDTLEGLGGSDDIEGFGGIDTAVYAGASTDFFFSRDGNFVTVGDCVGQEGFDHLFDFEFIYFAGDDVLVSVEDIPDVGTEGDDLIVGSGLMEELIGNGGDDTLIGGGGRDYLYGGSGADLMAGGTGDDDYEVDDAGDVVAEDAASGDDWVTAWIDYALPANVESLVLRGDATRGTGNGLANVIFGNWMLDSDLQGLGGADTLRGWWGDDVLEGGAGADALIGGGGADTFHYGALIDSNPAGFDTIADFLPGTDVIDLGAIDADPATASDDAFAYIGGAAFSAAGAASAGELRAFLVSGALWRAEGDTDGDGSADFVVEIVIDGAQALTASDFIL
jgi:Ca2+-binding RTX toxin-like protein